MVAVNKAMSFYYLSDPGLRLRRILCYTLLHRTFNCGLSIAKYGQ